MTLPPLSLRAGLCCCCRDSGQRVISAVGHLYVRDPLRPPADRANNPHLVCEGQGPLLLYNRPDFQQHLTVLSALRLVRTKHMSDNGRTRPSNRDTEFPRANCIQLLWTSGAFITRPLLRVSRLLTINLFRVSHLLTINFFCSYKTLANKR